jgi:hypothetical protein
MSVRSSLTLRAMGAALVVVSVALGALGASGMLGPASDRTRAEVGVVPDSLADSGPAVAGVPTPAEDDSVEATGPAGDGPVDGSSAAPEPSPFTTTAPRGAIDVSLWPVRVDVPALAVTAPVQAVGVGEARELIIPPSPMDVGWFQGGSVPGEPGVALLTSHVDTREQGRGVFAGLVTLEAGDLITVTSADGAVQRWTVVARTQHRKDALPQALFSRSGPAQLALVTCGGPFDRTARSYRDNVIVWAEPEA